MEVVRVRAEEDVLVALTLCFLGKDSVKFSQRMNELIQQRREEERRETGYQEPEKGYQTGY